MESKVSREGETSVLECMASGSPRPRIAWLKDGTTLTPTLRHFFTAQDQLLVIVHTESSDAGDYSCLLTNTLGSDRQVRLLVCEFFCLLTNTLGSDRQVILLVCESFCLLTNTLGSDRQVRLLVCESLY